MNNTIKDNGFKIDFDKETVNLTDDIKLTSNQLSDLHDIYERMITTYHILDICDELSYEEAYKLATRTRMLMNEYGGVEEDVIDEVIDEYISNRDSLGIE